LVLIENRNLGDLVRRAEKNSSRSGCKGIFTAGGGLFFRTDVPKRGVLGSSFLRCKKPETIKLEKTF